ncbi:MAG: hypothetical protein BWY77_01577 [bacterium ADurb.Bin431]|nr:MAG: hypothetical protein BWY77_01577 [bacterium ADurb.Bin431]HNY91177.1 hypothetical protein [bacterium]HOH07815.1 hypothetical protein [bacterium]
MKKSWLLLLSLLILAGCGKKQEVVQIGAFEKFQEPFLRISFSHPQGWQLQQDGPKIGFYSSLEAINKFNPYSVEGKDAARVIVNMDKMDTLKTLDEIVRSLNSDLTSSGFEVSSPVAKKVSDLDGKLLHYRGALDSKNIISGDEVVAVKDSMLYTIIFEGFNKMYEGSKVVLDSVLSSLHLPSFAAAAPGVDPAVPAEEMEVFENNFLKISYPANFQPSPASVKDPVQFALNIYGYRQDSGVFIDVRPAQGLTLEKVVEQNAARFKETSRGSATIDGVPATYLNYTGGKGISSRVYFLVKNDKFYRIIYNYYQPMKGDFQPVFDKMVASIKTK